MGNAVSLEPAGIVPIAKSRSNLIAPQNIVKIVQIEGDIFGHNVAFDSTIQFRSPPTVRGFSVQIMILELKDIFSIQYPS
jgi:hypothetical protein